VRLALADAFNLGGVQRIDLPATSARIPSKQIQINPSKIAWISLDLFIRIGTFQRVTGKKIKKIYSRLKLYAKRLKPSPCFSAGALRQAASIWQLEKSVDHDSDFGKQNACPGAVQTRTLG
jgi:hypothetical protein